MIRYQDVERIELRITYGTANDSGFGGSRKRYGFILVLLLVASSISACIGSRGNINFVPDPKISVSTMNTTVNISITFSANKSSDIDGRIITYNWSFDDGNYSERRFTQHSYRLPGTYQVKLTVVDNENATGWAYQKIIIT